MVKDDRRPVVPELRGNHMEIAPQALILAAGVVLSVVLISIMISQFRDAQNMSNAVGNQIVSKTQEIMENDIMQYDGLTVKGVDVINFYKKNLGEYVSGSTAPFVMTVAWAGGTFSYTDGTMLDKIRDEGSSHYIKPVSQWKCKVQRNKNGIITEVKFTKI